MKPSALAQLLTEERVNAFRGKYRPINVLAALAGLTTFLLYHGQVLGPADAAWVSAVQGGCLAAFAGETLGCYTVARSARVAFAQSLVDSGVLVAGGVVALALLLLSPVVFAAIDGPTATIAFGFLLQGAMMLFVVTRVLRAFSVVSRAINSPLAAFALSFVGIILFGAVLLLLPGATHSPGSMGIVNAVFLATSATCVTGLSTMDVGRDLTTFGQLVILGLIQVGGLGIMTFAGFFSLAFGRGMGVRDSVAMGEALNVSVIGQVGRTTAWIVGLTLLIELLGVAALTGHWRDTSGRLLGVGDQIYYSVFHSVSAFCNAGFSLHNDSLVSYSGDATVLLTVMGLIIVGGIGFFVVGDLLTYRFWAAPLFRRLPMIGKKVKHQRLPHLSLQTKMVTLATLALILGGAAMFWLLEHDGALAGKPIDQQVTASLFLSVTPRTAGFNTVDVGALRPVTNYATILLMLVGASPGGTGGGLKTTTVVVLFLAVIAMIRGRDPEIFRRRLAESQVRKSLVMLVTVLSVIGLAVFGLMLCESGNTLGTAGGFEALLFETVSAFCTVGLTMGVTPELTDPGKLIIIACMFVGRVGPLTLVLAIGRRVAMRYSYPAEEVMIG
ncbi:MAG: Trk family potassium uptake protein [Planctomycetes bacterium]|nr:Trk family potassium uptake protein [Planctomycetota bacterium]